MLFRSVTDGNAGADYAVTFVTATGSITAVDLTATVTVNGRTYDGTTGATIASCTLTGVVGTEDVTCDAADATATFASPHAGSRSVSISGLTLAGADAGNYTLASIAPVSATIATRPITVTAATDTKPYDGTTSSSGTPTITTGSLATGDSATWTQSFDTKAVGTGKTLTPAGSVTDGNAGADYAVTFVTATGSITAVALTATVTVDGRTYDGTTGATIASCTLTGVVGTEEVTCDAADATATFESPHAGSRSVSISGLALTGADAGNYTLASNATATATIATRPITVTAATDTKP